MFCDNKSSVALRIPSLSILQSSHLVSCLLQPLDKRLAESARPSVSWTPVGGARGSADSHRPQECFPPCFCDAMLNSQWAVMEVTEMLRQTFLNLPQNRGMRKQWKQSNETRRGHRGRGKWNVWGMCRCVRKDLAERGNMVAVWHSHWVWFCHPLRERPRDSVSLGSQSYSFQS